ncbi:MAG: transcriptional repressor LexA [Bacillota bacterium]|nr:transcriptional repressor LexA [Bacillota bacterium]
MKGLSPKQEAVLRYLEDVSASGRQMPTVREIAQAVGVSSTATIHQHLAALENKGFIRRGSYKHRAIELPHTSRPTVNVPLLGRIAAGQPILASENREEELPLPRDLVGEGEVFALTVRGDSMIEAGIHDGDLVVVRRQPTASNGEIVAAMVDDEATVKFFYREADRIRLQPANPAMEPIYARNVTILGRVILVIRKL